MNFSCPRTVTVHSYVLSCCALHASKYAPSYAHSSWYWAAVRRVICWPALSSYGQLINSSRLGVEMMFRFRFKIHFIIVFVLCLAGGIGEISSHCESFLCQCYVYLQCLNGKLINVRQ